MTAEPLDPDDVNAIGGHCPKCGTEYRPGFRVCADDGTELIPGPAPVPAETSQVGRLGRVDAPGQHAGGSHEPPAVLGSWRLQDALLLAGRLREEGIEAMAETDYELPSTPYTGFPHSVRVFVSPDRLKEARKIADGYFPS